MLGAVRHVLREIRGVAYEHRQAIDPGRTLLNRIIRGAATSDVVMASHEALASTVKNRKDGVQAVEILISCPIGFKDHPTYFEDAVTFFERFWSCPILLAVSHLDQTNPHLHILIAPFKGGRRCGSDLVGYKAAREALHRTFHQEVARKFGLELRSHLTIQERKYIVHKVMADIAGDPDRLLSGHLGTELSEILFAAAHRLSRFYSGRPAHPFVR